MNQLCDATDDEFKEIVDLVGMSSKPLHVKRLRKAIDEHKAAATRAKMKKKQQQQQLKKKKKPLEDNKRRNEGKESSVFFLKICRISFFLNRNFLD